MLKVLPQLLDAQTVGALSAGLLALPAKQWEDGRHSAGEQARTVKSNLQLAHEHPLAEQVRKQVLAALDRSPEFLSTALPARVFTPRVNRYDPEHPAYGWHIDNAIRLRDDGLTVRTDLSCTVALTSASSFEGGELRVRDADAEHAVALDAGDAVIYPSCMLHEVRPVTRGVRLACFFWIQSLVPGDTERRLLQELDTQLIALRQRHGESDETTALTGVYHNLLRLWARG